MSARARLARASRRRLRRRRVPQVEAQAAPRRAPAAAPERPRHRLRALAARALAVRRARLAVDSVAADPAAVAAEAAAAAARANSVRREAMRLWSGTADPDGRGLLEPGLEHQPTGPDGFDPLVLDAALRLARLAETVAERLRDCPDPNVRRSAAVLAARAHPLRAAFDT